MPSDTKCHCGRPLHYCNLATRLAAERMIALAGGDEYLTVTVADSQGELRHWRVQRHYIALHGITGAELEKLGFQEVFG